MCQEAQPQAPPPAPNRLRTEGCWQMKTTSSTLAVLVVLLGIFGVLATRAGAINEFDKYALESASASLTTTQAGAHADLTVSFKLSETEEKPYAQTRDVEVRTPPGVIGNPQAILRCSVEDFGNLPEESSCPLAAQVGVTEATVGGTAKGTFLEPIYNLPAPANSDIVARLGFFAVG